MSQGRRGVKVRRAVEKVSSNYYVEQLSIRYAVQDLGGHFQAARSQLHKLKSCLLEKIEAVAPEIMSYLPVTFSLQKLHPV